MPTKKEMVAELERRMRMYWNYHENWREQFEVNPNNITAQILKEYYKGKAHATEEAMRVVNGFF